MTATRRPMREGNLELLPVMNLVTILIPMLLMAAQLAELAAIDTTLPAVAKSDPVPPPGDTEPLVLRISRGGVQLRGVPTDVEVARELRCIGDVCAKVTDYPLAELTASLEAVKASRPDDDAVTIDPMGDVPYGVLVAVMDAARETDTRAPLFPRVTVSGGAPGAQE